MGSAVSAQGGGERRSLASWWHSRYGAQLMLEIAICGGLLIIYRAIRGFSKGDLQVAFANARDIISLEKWLGLPFEDDLIQTAYVWHRVHPVAVFLVKRDGLHATYIRFNGATDTYVPKASPLATPSLLDAFTRKT